MRIVLTYSAVPFVKFQPGLQKGSWSKEEDHVVKSMVMEMGVAKVKWSYVAEHVSTPARTASIPSVW
jgi:hypothetical protein